MDVKKSLFVVITIILTLGLTNLFGIDDARLLRSPDINGDKIVFSYGGDLWETSIAGGNAVRLTSHPGYEASPFFSPDGKWIAFTGQYDGNYDVYIIPAEGGSPKRLTYHPEGDGVTGWSADSKYVYFRSMRNSQNRYLKIFKVSIEGGLPEPLPMPMAWVGSESQDGKFFAYSPLSSQQSFLTWRRYRGGHAPFIWIFNYADLSVKKIPHPNCNDFYPEWIGDQVYFLSDRDRVMNLYSYDGKSDAVKQLTTFQGSDIKAFGADNKRIVFERDGYLHVMDPETKSIKKITVNISGDLVNRRPGFKKAGRLIENAAISPTGKRVAFEARGEILTVPAKKGDVRNITKTTGKMERLPAWSPDGQQIAYFGEYNDRYALFVVDQKGESKAKVFEMDMSAYYFNLQWSPDSKKLLFRNHYQTIFYLDITQANAKAIPVDTDESSLCDISYSWSPDSNWITYTKSGKNEMRVITLYSLKQAKSFPVSDGMSDARYPVFSPDGKYLYFTASTNRAFDVSWVDLTNYNHKIVSGIYLAVLSASEPSPFKPESDEEKKPEGDKADNAAKGAKDKKKKDGDKAEENATKIDIEGIGSRIVAVSVPIGRYSSLSASDGTLYYLETVDSLQGDKHNLHAYDMKKQEDKTIIEGIDEYWLSADQKTILYRQNRFQWMLADSNGKSAPGEGMVPTSELEVYAEPLKEWRQILFEAWRINKDYFYDPGMHGQDWNAVWKKYEQYIPYVAHRGDLNYILEQLIGELCVGHAYVGGGDYPEVDNVPGGLLGADFEIDSGHYKFKKIYDGEHWNPSLRAPLREPGIHVKEGDYLLAVNGQPVKAPENVYSFFEKTAGKQVKITVNSTPQMAGAKTYTVVPIAMEFRLRIRQWIEENRKKVEKLSNGKIGYVHLPDTAAGGYTFFNRYYFAHLDKEAMVLDERFNGGGYAADYIINLLNRPFMNSWIGRWGKPDWTPGAAIFGPKAMIINEYAGSGGDAMPYYFKQQKIGKLIGKRTWGGLVGIITYPPLMDGGFVTSPTISFVDPDGNFTVENEGVAPDIEVEQIPEMIIKGHDPQLEAAVKHLLEELKNYTPRKFKHNGFPRGR